MTRTPGDDITEYLRGRLPPRDPVLTQLEEEAESNGVPIVAAQEAVLLWMLAALARPASMVELGTATGYSGIWLLRGFPDARLVTFELDPARAARARRSFEEAGLSDRVDLREENAVEGLGRLAAGSADLIFNDLLNGLRDEERVELCFHHSMEVLKPGGLLLTDNALAGGEVLEPRTQAARCVLHWNRLVAEEPALTTVIVPIGDGLSIALRS